MSIELPDKKYFTIGEVGEICDLKSHVLRYWEQMFPQLQPSKRRGRRYYQKKDVELVLEIKSLLQDQGFTIQGAKTRLDREQQGEAWQEEGVESPNLLAQIRLIKQDLNAFQSYLQEHY